MPQEEELSQAKDTDRFPRAALPIGLGMIVAGGIAGNSLNRQIVNENNNQEKAPISHTNTSGHTVGELPPSHVSNLVSVPTHEEAVAILANARPVVSPDGPMVEEFGSNQSETGPFQTKNGNFQLLHSGQLAQGLSTAVSMEKVGDKIVTTEGP